MSYIKAVFKALFVMCIIVLIAAPKIPILMFLMFAELGGHPNASVLGRKIFLWPLEPFIDWLMKEEQS